MITDEQIQLIEKLRDHEQSNADYRLRTYGANDAVAPYFLVRTDALNAALKVIAEWKRELIP